MKIRPLGKRILAKRIKPDTKVNGIILPESGLQKQDRAEIIDAHPEIEISVLKGSIVLIEKYSGQEVEVDGEQFIIIKDENIIAVLEE